MLLAVENGAVLRPGWETVISKELALPVRVCPFYGGLCASDVACSNFRGRRPLLPPAHDPLWGLSTTVTSFLLRLDVKASPRWRQIGRNIPHAWWVAWSLALPLGRPVNFASHFTSQPQLLY